MRYQSNKPKRRFIAGAVCKSCGAIDKTVLITMIKDETEIEWIECIACNHTENRPTEEDLQKMQKNEANDTISVIKFKP